MISQGYCGFVSGLDWSGGRFGVGVKEDIDDTEDTEETEDTEDTEDMEETENMEDV